MIRFALSVLPVTPSDWIELARTGAWKGHPQGAFSLAEQDLHEMALNFRRDRRGRIVVDYEHQTLRSAKNGQPAPAAGWVTAVEVQQDDDGPKLMGKVDWTQSATTAIAAAEYAYISPVIIFKAKDKASGAVIGTRLHSAALTNSPFLDELAAVVASSLELSDMNLLTLLIPLLALPQAATEADVVRSVEELSTGRKAVCGALGLRVDAADDELKTSLTQAATPLAVGRSALQLLSLSDATPLAEAQAALKPALEHAGYIAATDHAKVLTELAGLKAEQLVAGAIEAGKVVPATESWARTFAATDPVAFGAWCKVAPRVVPEADINRKGPRSTTSVALSDIELETARQLGLSPESYTKAKE